MLSLRPRHVKRYAELVRLLAKHGRSDLVHSAGLEDALVDDDLDAHLHATEDAERAAELAADLEALGPTYVKLGQLLSTRADLLPPAYLTALSRLQDDLEPVPFDEVAVVVEHQLGGPVEQHFASFDPKPMASASIGQVHRAVLPAGQPVAVKVQRPGIRARIAEDLDVLAELAELLDDHTELGRIYGFADLVEELRRTLVAELDYRLEADNLITMAEDLSRFERIAVPAPVPSLSTAKVLTMELVEGTKVTETAPGLHGPALAEQLFAAYLEQILVNGFVHADPHPGNVLLTGDGRLALIDLGMVARLDPHVRLQLTKLMVAISEQRGHDVAEILELVGTTLPGYDGDALRSGIGDLVSRHANATVEDLGAGTVIMELMAVCSQARLRLPAELALVGKAMMNLDEVARTLDPSFEPGDALRRHGDDILRRELAPGGTTGWLQPVLEARELMEALPRRAKTVIDALAAGELTVKVDAIDQDELLRGVEKVANRVTVGLLLAAIIIGAAMTMRVETTSTLLGYPSISIVFFVGAALGSAVLMTSIVLGDRRRRRRTG